MRLGNLGTKGPTLKRLCRLLLSQDIEMAQPPQQSRSLLTPRSNVGSESEPIATQTSLIWVVSAPKSYTNYPPHWGSARTSLWQQLALTSQHEWCPSEHQGSAWSLSSSLLNKNPLSQGTHKSQICMGMGSMPSGEVIRGATETQHINWNWTYLSWYSTLQVNVNVKLRENRISILFQTSLRIPEFHYRN